MGINVNGLSPTEAQKYWYDYNNGNSKGLSEAEYQSLCTKFRSYLDNWEAADENGYTAYDTPEDRLDYDADDAGLGFNEQTGQAATGTTVAVGAGAAVSAITTGAASMTAFGTMAGEAAALTAAYGAESISAQIATNTAQKAATKNSGLLLATAALQFATMLWYKLSTPNKEAAEALETAQGELYTEQANLADQVLTMEEMQEEMELLQEEALAVNEQGQGEIGTLEGLYNYYYTKYQNGTATEKEIALMRAIGMQMSATQSTTNDETEGLNSEIVEVGAGYEDITTNIETTNEFTGYVSEIDQSTKAAAIVQGTVLALSAASATFTCIQCVARATTLSASVFGLAAAAMYYAAAALSGTAAAFFGIESVKQFTDYRGTAEDTIDIRKNTQDLSTETTEFQEVSTEFWEETVDTTSADNLFTLTPTYATSTPATGGAAENSGTEDGAAPESGNNSTANPFGGTEGTPGTNPFGGNTGSDPGTPSNPFAPDKDKEK